MSAEHLRTWPSAARSLRAAASRHCLHREPGCHLGSFSVMALLSPLPPSQGGRCPANPSSQNISQATQEPVSNNSMSKYKCHLNPMATEPSITISQPNGSADFSPTENGSWLGSRPPRGRARVTGYQGLKTVGRKQGETGFDQRGAVQGERCPRQRAPHPLRSASSCHRLVPSTSCPQSSSCSSHSCASSFTPPNHASFPANALAARRGSCRERSPPSNPGIG